eukprot:364643-Chlamydomonas_euryale.AAC.8
MAGDMPLPTSHSAPPPRHNVLPLAAASETAQQQITLWWPPRTNPTLPSPHGVPPLAAASKTAQQQIVLCWQPRTKPTLPSPHGVLPLAAASGTAQQRITLWWPPRTNPTLPSPHGVLPLAAASKTAQQQITLWWPRRTNPSLPSPHGVLPVAAASGTTQQQHHHRLPRSVRLPTPTYRAVGLDGMDRFHRLAVRNAHVAGRVVVRVSDVDKSDELTVVVLAAKHVLQAQAHGALREKGGVAGVACVHVNHTCFALQFPRPRACY